MSQPSLLMMCSKVSHDLWISLVLYTYVAFTHRFVSLMRPCKACGKTLKAPIKSAWRLRKTPGSVDRTSGKQNKHNTPIGWDCTQIVDYQSLLKYSYSRRRRRRRRRRDSRPTGRGCCQTGRGCCCQSIRRGCCDCCYKSCCGYHGSQIDSVDIVAD